MSHFARVAEDANRVDSLLAGGFLVGAAGALEVMRSYIESQGPEGLGAAHFERCCLQWLGRVLRLADARNAQREAAHEPWSAWFAEANARVHRARTEREMALVRRVVRS